jgi:DNA repair protein RadC
MQIKGIGEQQATLISMVVPLTRVWHRCAMTVPDRIGNSREAENYCLSILAGERTERFYVVCMNAKCNVLGRRKISEGSLSEVSAYPRMVMETALNYNAHSVLLCHNHPGGEAMPSRGDVEVTRNLEQILSRLGIALLEHIIVADEQSYSMSRHEDYQCSVLQTDGVWSLREAGTWDDEWA